MSYIGQDCEEIPEHLGRDCGHFAKRLDLSFNLLRYVSFARGGPGPGQGPCLLLLAQPLPLPVDGWQITPPLPALCKAFTAEPETTPHMAVARGLWVQAWCTPLECLSSGHPCISDCSFPPSPYETRQHTHGEGMRWSPQEPLGSVQLLCTASAVSQGICASQLGCVDVYFPSFCIFVSCDFEYFS